MKTTSLHPKTILVSLAVAAATLLSVFVPAGAYAASAVQCAAGQTANSAGVCSCPAGQQAVSVPVDSSGTTCVPINSRTTDISQNPIFFYLRNILIFLAGGVGLAVVGGIIFGAYLYITARANAAQVQKGQTTILNSVLGLIIFICMYAILQFLIPGGIFQ